MGWMVNAHGVYCKKSNDGPAEGDKRGRGEKEVEKDKMSTNRREGMRRTQIQYKNVYTFLCGVAVW
jgi:hypothetical protein